MTQETTVMNIQNFYNHGTMIEITGNHVVNLNIEKGEVHLEGKPVAPDTVAEDTTENSELVCPFTEEQVKASGIKLQAAVVLSLMHSMCSLWVQKVDWLSAYSVLLRRRWVDNNLSAYCRMVGDLFGVSLDNRTLSSDLKKNGFDYTLWTEADERIVRRKLLASDFDTRLTEYFERKRAAVMNEVMG